MASGPKQPIPDYVQAYRGGDEERLGKLMKFADKELKSVAAQQLSAD